MFDVHSFLIIAVCSAVTVVLRFLPFLVFGGKRETPQYILYLGKHLPYAIMAMLVVYCLRGIELTSAPFGVPELISCAVVTGLHIWKRNTLVSILCGTLCYMALVQFVFV